VQDWDDAPGAIDWPRFAKFLEGVKDRGILLEHHSHDHLNEQKEVPVAKELSERWKSKFVRIQAEHASRGERVVWALVDGFLLYWDTVRRSTASLGERYRSAYVGSEWLT